MALSATVLPGGRLAAFNPAIKLACATVLLLGLLASADLVSVSVVLGVELVAIAVAGLRLADLARRAWPLPLAAAGVAISNLIASDAGPATTAAISLRLFAIALPGMVVFATTEAVDIADSLVQQCHVPARFSYGTLAALRLLPLLGEEWQTIARARRARGIDAGRLKVHAVSLFCSGVYGLLIAAIRRAVRLSAAMDSRGFASGRTRTIARHQVVHARDYVALAATTAVVIAANLLAVALHTWHPIFR